VTSLGREQSSEKEADGLVEAGVGSDAQMFECAALHETLHGVEKKLGGERRQDVVADRAAQLALFDEAAEDVGDGARACSQQMTMQRRRARFQFEEEGGGERRKTLDHRLCETAEFLDELQTALVEQLVGIGANLGGDAVDHGAQRGVLAGEMNVERFFAHAAREREIVHGERGVTAGKKERPRLGEDAIGRA